MTECFVSPFVGNLLKYINVSMEFLVGKSYKKRMYKRGCVLRKELMFGSNLGRKVNWRCWFFAAVYSVT